MVIRNEFPIITRLERNLSKGANWTSGSFGTGSSQNTIINVKTDTFSGANYLTEELIALPNQNIDQLSEPEVKIS